jgi:Ni/Co efflux regulator RcnB
MAAPLWPRPFVEEIVMKLISRLFMAATLLTTSSLALAQDQRDHNQRGQGHGQGDSRHDVRHDDHRQQGDRRDDHRRYGYRDAPRYDRHRHWERGHRYDGPTYVVHDYGHYRLRPPPRGYHWVRADNDYLLVGIATGIILDMALH